MGSAFARSTERSTVVNNSIAIALLNSDPEDSGILCHRIEYIHPDQDGEQFVRECIWREVDTRKIDLSHQLCGVERSILGPTILCEGQEQYCYRTAVVYICEQDGGHIHSFSYVYCHCRCGNGASPTKSPCVQSIYVSGKANAEADWESRHHQDSSNSLAIVTIRAVCQQDQCSLGGVGW